MYIIYIAVGYGIKGKHLRRSQAELIGKSDGRGQGLLVPLLDSDRQHHLSFFSYLTTPNTTRHKEIKVTVHKLKAIQVFY